MWRSVAWWVVATAACFGCSSSSDDTAPVSLGGSSGASAGGTVGGGAGGRPAPTAGAAGNVAEGESGGRTSGGGEASGGGGGQSAGGAGGDRAGGTAGAGMGGTGGTGGGSATCVPPLTVGDLTHLQAMEIVETYEVSGTTATEVRQSINENRGRDYDGLTEWDLAWRVANCADPTWTVTLSITYSLPHWEAPTGADAALVARWQSYIDALTCHEYGHGTRALDCARRAYDALAGLPGNDDCSALSSAAKAVFDGNLAECRARDVTYDAETMHGRTMGAVFP